MGRETVGPVGNGGEIGIRNRDRVSRIHSFQVCAFNHSAFSTMKWIDARNGETGFDDQMNFFSQVDLNSTPVMAPEGTLLALMERWWRGEVQNRAPLRDELEAAVIDALQCLKAYEESARESLRAHSEIR